MEAEEKTEEEKVEEPAEATVETGFNATAGDWDSAAPGAFAGAAATTAGGWDGAAGDEWAASAAPTGDWATDGAKESQW